MIDDCNINNLAKNQVSAVLNSHAIRRSMSPEFIELCMGCAPLEGHKHGGRNVTKTSIVEFCYWNEISTLELRNIERNYSSCASTVHLAKFKAITHL